MGVPKVTCPSTLLLDGLYLRMPGYLEVDDECWPVCVCGEWGALALWMVLKCHTHLSLIICKQRFHVEEIR